MLELEVGLRRGGFTLDVTASLEGPATALFGPSGAGKSTLLGVVAGLVRPGRGRVVLDGEVLDDAERGVHVPTHRRRVGVVFQDGRLFPHLSAGENLRFPERFVPPARRRFQAEEVVRWLALEPLLKRSVRSLSGGEAQRVALGRALLASPRLLLMDEPLSALDKGLRGEILPLLHGALQASGLPVVYVSHDLAEALQISREMLLLKGGRIAGRGPFLDLLEIPEALDLFRDQGLLNVVAARVAGHRAEDAVTLIEPLTGGSGGVSFKSALSPGHPAGREIRVALRPEDVALALAPVAGTSIQNQVPGTIRRVVQGERRTLVVIDAGLTLLADVTRQSEHELDLRAGRPVWCLFKAQALRILDAAASGPADGTNS